ncbi:MAG TPA: aromatic ring-hydroxylating dioxygenase subunit alpha [Anaeromyxobacter sp.]|nr:aromatic ring-hydroxylating dioxygenase subunit alpha [Anaeromyxobacter sp.]
MDPNPSPASPERRRPAPRLPGWFVACTAAALRDRPLAATVQGVPLVLFRAPDGAPAALEDRCPHRNAPLSAGRLRGGALECAYHGWRFGPGGGCVAVPGLAAPPEARATRATGVPCVEQDGFVWVAPAGAPPAAAPRRLPHLGAARYTTVRNALTVRASLFRAVENVLDVPHTAYLHGGLFRTAGAAREIEVVVRRWPDRCEAEYLGEPRPPGLVGRLLAPRGGVVQHFDRFLLPCIAEVEYRLGETSHLVATTAATPIDDEHTRLFSAVTFRLPVPGAAVAPLLAPVARRILRQDAWMLALQTETVARFGGERFATTDADVLGPQIARLLRAVEERGAVPAAADGPPEHERRVRMVL